MAQKASARVYALARQREGLRLVAYQNRGDKPSLGYGHTEGVKLGDTCTEAQAEQWLADEIAEAERLTTHTTRGVALTQGQFDALVDWVYNEGDGKLKTSTLLQFVLAGNMVGAAGEFMRWVYCDGVVEPGLVTRRSIERGWFEEHLSDDGC